MELWQYVITILLCSCAGSIIGGLSVLMIDAAVDTFKDWYRWAKDVIFGRQFEPLTYPAEWLLDVFNGKPAMAEAYATAALARSDFNCKNCGAPKMGQFLIAGPNEFVVHLVP